MRLADGNGKRTAGLSVSRGVLVLLFRMWSPECVRDIHRSGLAIRPFSDPRRYWFRSESQSRSDERMRRGNRAIRISRFRQVEINPTANL
jgi:hypothetical protein